MLCAVDNIQTDGREDATRHRWGSHLRSNKRYKQIAIVESLELLYDEDVWNLRRLGRYYEHYFSKRETECSCCLLVAHWTVDADANRYKGLHSPMENCQFQSDRSEMPNLNTLKQTQLIKFRRTACIDVWCWSNFDCMSHGFQKCALISEFL